VAKDQLQANEARLASAATEASNSAFASYNDAVGKLDYRVCDSFIAARRWRQEIEKDEARFDAMELRRLDDDLSLSLQHHCMRHTRVEGTCKTMSDKTFSTASRDNRSIGLASGVSGAASTDRARA
jgi:hypothetical protein